MERAVEQQLIEATRVVEQQLDAEIERLERLDDDDLEALRQRRLAALRRQADQRRDWLAAGQGEYREVPGEREFFDECRKGSGNVVCHFYRESTPRCKIVDKHLALLAPRHVETKFVKIDVEKAPFLTERLKVRMLPTLVLWRDNKAVDYIVGFDDLGGTDEFSTEMLEWRIARADVINYSGDLMTPPNGDSSKGAKSILFGDRRAKKNLRDGNKAGDGSDDEDDW